MRRLVLTLATGDKFVLDRDLREQHVVQTINNARGSGQLISLPVDSMPRGDSVYIDPDAVVSVGHR